MQPGDNRAIWPLSPGQPPRRILDTGQNLPIPTASGTVQAAVSSLDVPNGGATYAGGDDTWVGADGTVMISPVVDGYGEVITARPSDRIFADGFES